MSLKTLTLGLSLTASLLLVSSSVAATKALPPASDKKGVTYDKDIKPLFEKNCFKCHGAEKQKGKLRLDSLAAVMKGGENGKAVIAGKSADSPMVKAVARVVEDDAMPPADKGKPLTAAEVGLIRAWIDQGAK